MKMHSVSSRALLLPASLLLTLASANPVRPGTGCPNQPFDYVIVGGGTAGGVLAARLTEDPSITVAVIEAGTWPENVHGNWTQVPMFAGNFYHITDPMMWPFTTTPQTALTGAGGVRPYFRPKAFGGCSDVNAMAFGHSSVGAHKMLADAVGDQSYTYDKMLQYYHKTMNFTPYDYSSTRFANATPEYNSADTVTGGGLGVSYPAYAQPWSTWLSKGLEAIGLKKVPAFINGNLMGQSFHQNTIFHSNGHRSSSESAYLRPAAVRRNLFLYDYTMAERILFDRSKTATGVQVNGTCTISARREVLLSAGVFQSPQLLMVSGVGPKDVLRAHNIPVVVDRPGVGQNLQEHIVSFVAYQVNVDTGDRLADPAYLQQAINEFNDHASGPLTSVGGDFMAMEKIPEDLRASWPESTKQALGRLPADWPEIAYAILPSAIPAEFATPVVPPIPGANYAAAVFVLFAPQSVGNVTIASADVHTPPLINPALFSHQADVDVMVAGLKRVRQALATEDMAPVLIGPETVPGAQVQTDEQIIEFLRSTVNPFQHAFSTNKMGKPNDPSAVVDSNGKVYGVKNLRVVDASAFPFLPPGPAPQIQVYTHAEKFADLIKADRHH